MKYPNILTGAVIGAFMFASTVVGVELVARKWAPPTPAPIIQTETQYIDANNDEMVVGIRDYNGLITTLAVCEKDNADWTKKNDPPTSSAEGTN